MKDFKNKLFSPKGMTIVNIALICSFLLNDSLLICVSMCLWIAYLRYAIKSEEVSGSKKVYKGILIVAIVLFVLYIIALIL